MSGQASKDAENSRRSESISDRQFAIAMFALEEGGRTLEQQQTELDRLRERSITQLGIGFALVTFIVGAILDAKPSKGVAFYGLMMLTTMTAGLAVALSYRVWRTVKRWKMKVNPELIIRYAKPEGTLADLETLVGYYEKARANNEPFLTQKRSDFRMATAATAALLTLLIVGLWSFG